MTSKSIDIGQLAAMAQSLVDQGPDELHPSHGAAVRLGALTRLVADCSNEVSELRKRASATDQALLDVVLGQLHKAINSDAASNIESLLAASTEELRRLAELLRKLAGAGSRSSKQKKKTLGQWELGERLGEGGQAYASERRVASLDLQGDPGEPSQKPLRKPSVRCFVEAHLMLSLIQRRDIPSATAASVLLPSQNAIIR